jgi:hypothetical protein
MTTIQIELPDDIAEEARGAGFLTSEHFARWLSDALKRRRAADALLSLVDQVEAHGIPPMPMEEIVAEIKAYRAERRIRASGS